MSTTNPVALADANRLRHIARNLSYDGPFGAEKHVLFEVAMRMETGFYAAYQPALQARPDAPLCACIPGTCRGGDVVNGQLQNGWRCRATEPCVPPNPSPSPATAPAVEVAP